MNTMSAIPKPRPAGRRETPERVQRNHEVADADRRMPARYYRARLEAIHKEEQVEREERTKRLEEEVRRSLSR